MNVFFVLLTTVSAGDSGCGAPAVHAPVVSASCGSCCDACCGATDCCEKPRRGHFSRRRSRSCDTCAPACCAPACAPVTTCAPACTSTCSSCDSCCEVKQRRGLFRRRSKDCCATTCDGCGSGCGSDCGGAVSYPAAGHPAVSHPTVIHPAPTTVTPGKPVEAIKKMPSTDEKKVEPDKKGAAVMPQAPVTPTGAQVEPEAKNPF